MEGNNHRVRHCVLHCRQCETFYQCIDQKEIIVEALMIVRLRCDGMGARHGGTQGQPHGVEGG